MKDLEGEFVDSISTVIQEKVVEQQDEFIYQSIMPYFESRLEMHIPKQMIKEALTNYKGIAPELEGGNSIYYHVCGECHLLLHDNWKFCPECGRKVLWNG